MISGSAVGTTPEIRSVLALAVAILSASTRDGHTLLDLGPHPSSPYVEDLPSTLPPVTRWAELIGEVVGGPDRPFPVILDKNGLYLSRHYRAEIRVAEEIGRRLLKDHRDESAKDPALPEEIERLLETLFPVERESDPHLPAPRAAALASLRRSFLVITGGPGTGKTWTSARILSLHRTLFPSARIVAAAPTGKAAARMGQALGEANIPGPPIPAMTLHRLLDAGQQGFARSRKNPLPWDLVLVDELSMIDLPLMERLLGALPERSRLILTGDQDQLASVGAGRVMADLCVALSARPSGETGGALTILTHNYRQSDSAGLRAFSQAVAAGDVPSAFGLLGRNEGGLSLFPPSIDDRLPLSLMREGWQSVLQTEDPEEVLGRLDRFMVLTPLREGPLGSQRANTLFHAFLRRSPEEANASSPALIFENSYETGLMNGDLGILNGSRLLFQKEGRLIDIPERLSPDWGFSYAMTIHKSQGSEFDHILLLIGPRDHPLLTRSLLYTAATRARKRLSIWASSEILERMILRRIERSSALDLRIGEFLARF